MTNSGKDFLLLQELPDFDEAVRRAEASLLSSNSSTDDNVKGACRCCPHLEAILPNQLSLTLVPIAATTAADRWILQDPISALHLQSQLESPDSGFIVTATAERGNEPPVLYGEEQERWMAARTQGFADTWHPWIHPTLQEEQHPLSNDPTMTIGGASPPPAQPILAHSDMSLTRNGITSSLAVPLTDASASSNIQPQARVMNTDQVSAHPVSNQPATSSVVGQDTVGTTDATSSVTSAAVVTVTDGSRIAIPAWSVNHHNAQQHAQIAEWKSISLQAAEDQIVHVRRECLSKRQSALHKKKQLDQIKVAVAATDATPKKRKPEHIVPSTLMQMPAWRQYAQQRQRFDRHGAMSSEQHGEWLERRREAVARVESWMENFRQSRLRYWREEKLSPERATVAQSKSKQKQSNKSLRSELSPASFFGAFTDSSVPSTAVGALGDLKSGTHLRTCQICSSHTKDIFLRDAWFPIGCGSKDAPHNLQGDDLMQCLECSFTGCSPVSMCSKRDETRQHILHHFLSSNHSLAVTCGPQAQIYCFPCGEFVCHEIFDEERHRIDLTENLPWLAWKEHPVKRSFEALQFLNVRDLGIFWTGMRATYPILVPREHIAATRLCRARQIVFMGEIDKLPVRASRQAVEATVQQHLALPMERWRIPAPVGMYNLGNTCFMTAILQCLVHCVPLQQYFLRDIGHNQASCAIYRMKAISGGSAGQRQPAVAVCLACELDRLFMRYMDSASGRDLSSVVIAVSSQSLQDDVESTRTEKALDQGEPLLTADMLTAAWKCGDMKHLAGYEQRDAHEFLHGFLDILGKHMRDYRTRLMNSINTARPDNAYLTKVDTVQYDEVRRLFEGTLRSVLMCCECGNKRIQTEPFVSISLPLSKEVVKSNDSSNCREILSVDRCLNHFTQPEKLSDPVDCPKCGKKTPTNKQHAISMLPKILCLHLKRFDSAQNKKIEDFVSFPSTGLDMGRYLPHWCEVSRVHVMRNDNVDEQTTPQVAYDLFATVNHFGSLQSGHYVANVKVRDMWYHCNDSHIVHAGVGNGEAEVLRSEGAYILFYARR